MPQNIDDVKVFRGVGTHWEHFRTSSIATLSASMPCLLHEIIFVGISKWLYIKKWYDYPLFYIDLMLFIRLTIDDKDKVSGERNKNTQRLKYVQWTGSPILHLWPVLIDLVDRHLRSGMVVGDPLLSYHATSDYAKRFIMNFKIQI